MKRAYLLIISTAFLHILNAQPLVHQWSTNVGGSLDEVNGFFMDGKASLDVDTEGNVIMVTGSLSSDGMITDSKGGEDCFIVKYNADGIEMWSKSFGGSGNDRPRKLISLSNGDFLIAGYTNSNDGDLIGHHGGSDGYSDGFLARFDKDGAIIWAKQYGGTEFAGSPGRDYFYSCLEKSNGDIIAVGNTNSQNGDLTPDWITSSPSFSVGWFVMVGGNTGDLITSKRVRSSAHSEINENTLEDIATFSNGSGYCTVGLQGYFLNGVHWVTKLDTTGELVWNVEIGNVSGLYVYQTSVVETYDGNVMIALVTGDGTTAGYNGGITDMWVVKLDAGNGSILSEMSFGGSDTDMPYKLLPDNHGKYYLAGTSRSTDGFAHGGSESFDNFIIYMDESFDTLWTYKFGGTADDRATDLAIDNSGDVYVAGRTESSDVFYSSNFGGKDAWVGRFSNPLFDVVEDKKRNHINAYPNPTLDDMILEISSIGSDNEDVKVEISDVYGRRITSAEYAIKNTFLKQSLGMDKYSSGTYLLKISINGEQVYFGKIIKL